MRALVDLFVKRPVFAAMLIATFVVVGVFSYTRLRVDRFPSVDLPTVSVRTQLPGASVEEVETLVSQRIEEAVNTVDGIDQLRSIATNGSSFVMITFALERDIEAAAQDVRDRVASVMRDLPPEIEPPIVSKFDNDQSPVLTFALSSDRPIRELSEIADKLIKPQIENSLGVGEVRLSGAAERAINIFVDAQRLVAFGLPITAVQTALRRQNVEVPGGNVTGVERESVLRTMGQVREPA